MAAYLPTKPMRKPPLTSALLALVLLVTSQVGCIALSIPSERQFDPADHGGLFGDWDQDTETTGQCCDHPHRSFDDLACDGGPLESDPLDASLKIKGKPKKDEVPWPRFHPVPTRPVFGGPVID